MMIDRCTRWHRHRRFPLGQLAAQMIRRAISLIVGRTKILQKRVALFQMMVRVAGRHRFLLRMIRCRGDRPAEFVHHQIVAGGRRSVGIFDIFLFFRINVSMVKIIEVRDDHRHGQGDGQHTGYSTHGPNNFAEDSNGTHITVANLKANG